MPKYMTKEEVFSKCERDGRFIQLENIDLEKIRSSFAIAEEDFEAAKSLRNLAAKENSRWNSIYKLYYDALHELAEILLRFDRFKSDNHQCLFAYLCEKHPELGLDWDFFEKLRTKRNGINYYGMPITYDDFKEMELWINLSVEILKKAIKKQMGH